LTDIRGHGATMTFRRDLLTLLSVQPRSVSSLAREMGLDRRDVEDDLRHAIRSARASGHRVVIEPARCKQCGFVFSEDKLSKPGKCPECRGTRLFEAQIRIE
jgi:predicted Zn-ribbon and HTH transcriptional regulator